jgi:hypothetical protein
MTIPALPILREETEHGRTHGSINPTARGYGRPFQGATALTYDPPASQTETRCYRRVATNECGKFIPTPLPLPFMPILTVEQLLRTKLFAMGSDPAAFTAVRLQAVATVPLLLLGNEYRFGMVCYNAVKMGLPITTGRYYPNNNLPQRCYQ